MHGAALYLRLLICLLLLTITVMCSQCCQTQTFSTLWRSLPAQTCWRWNLNKWQRRRHRHLERADYYERSGNRGTTVTEGNRWAATVWKWVKNVFFISKISHMWIDRGALSCPVYIYRKRRMEREMKEPTLRRQQRPIEPSLPQVMSLLHQVTRPWQLPIKALIPRIKPAWDQNTGVYGT